MCALHDYKFCYKLQINMLPVNFTSDMINRLNTYRNHIHFTRRVNDVLLPTVRHEFARQDILQVPINN